MPFEPPGAPVTVSRVDDVWWELVDPLTYQGRTDTWVVPPGFRTDFASVPIIGVWLIARTGAYTPAAIVHDFLVTVAVPAGLITPSDADGVFRRIAREEGVPPVRRWIMWAGVRWGALVTPARRAGWWADAPLVAAVTVAALPVVLPAAVGIAVGWWLYRAAEWAAGAVGAVRRG